MMNKNQQDRTTFGPNFNVNQSSSHRLASAQVEIQTKPCCKLLFRVPRFKRVTTDFTKLLIYRRRFQFHFENSTNRHEGYHPFSIDDGCQPPVELISVYRDIIAATFTLFLLKNIGGSETFADKQDFFYHEVRKRHQKHYHEKLPMKVQRDKLLESVSTNATYNIHGVCRVKIAH